MSRPTKIELNSVLHSSVGVMSHVQAHAASVNPELNMAVGERAYHELRENPHFEIDGIQRLQQNLAQIEELQGRLQFMLREVATLTKTRTRF